MGLIYKITCILNNKIYIGQTITTLNERWSGHKCDSKRRNTPLYASMRKHAENIDAVFKIEILEDDIPYEKLDEREIYWIEELNSLYPNGYNISEGGQTYLTDDERKRMSDRVKGEKNPMYGKTGELNPFFNKKHSEETKELLRQHRLGKQTHDEKSKAKISESIKKRHQQIGHPFKGKHHTQDAKLRISNSLKGRKFSDEHVKKMIENHARKRSVVMLDKEANEIMTFGSMSDAAKWLRNNTNYEKAKSSEISTVCSGRRKTAYGYVWRYLEGVETIPDGSRMEH